MRKGPFLATILGVAMLASGLLLWTGAQAQQRTQVRALDHDARQVSASFSAYFERARSLDLLLAQDPALSQATAGEQGLFDANRALRFLQSLYAGVAGEACLIDQDGRELARVTNGVPASQADLSPDERQNTFFAMTMSRHLGEVYQAAPYVSPDTHTWVISNSTWVLTPDGRRMIVHFEVSLAGFEGLLDARAAGRHVAVVERHSGRVILRDGQALPPTSPNALFPVTAWSVGFDGTSRTRGSLRALGTDVAFTGVPHAAANANDWLVVDWGRHRDAAVLGWLGLLGALLGLGLVAGAMAHFRRQHRRLQAAARLDHLTGLANRQALEEAADAAVVAARRDGERVAVLVMDLDGFKQINDALGHDRGDQVLQEIARRLHANVFEYDTAARLGGDEFAVVVRRLRELDDVSAVAHRLRDALVRPIDLDGTPHFIGVSIGAALFPAHGTSTVDLLRAADAAMYRAKRNREGVRVYEVGTAGGAVALTQAASLLRAIEIGDIYLAYQPIFDSANGAIVGVEALARWNGPEGDAVPPDVFIPLAEETGLIRPLTMLTFRLALDEAARWKSAGSPMPVSVNLSARVVSDPALAGDIEGMLTQCGLSGDSLVVEVTETAVIHDRDAAIATLQALRDRGVRVELDDFGSGYASLGVLRYLPLDGVKIDRGLVGDESPGATALLHAAVSMAQRLGLTAVAEGVETEAMLRMVRTAGCERAQGYHLSRPIGPEQVRQLLLKTASPATL